MMWLALNKTRSIEPRINLQYRANPNHTISFAIGQHGKILPLGSYFYKTASGSLPNKDLDIMKSTQFVLAYDWLMKKNWRVHIEGYLQKLTAIPVVNDINRTFWLLNMIDGYANEALVSSGTGRNRGVDLALEKFFSKRWFMISSISVFNSTYAPLSGKNYDTQYNSRTAGSFTTGREWKWKKEKTLSFFNDGMQYYLNKSFASAIDCFQAILEKHPEDKTTAFFLDSAIKHLQSGVPENWAGVVEMVNK